MLGGAMSPAVATENAQFTPALANLGSCEHTRAGKTLPGTCSAPGLPWRSKTRCFAGVLLTTVGTGVRQGVRARKARPLGIAASVTALTPASGSWCVATAEDLAPSGNPATGFDRVCMVDARSLLGTSWDTFHTFAAEGLSKSASAVVSYDKGPPILVRRVKDGSQLWPILQEGRN